MSKFDEFVTLLRSYNQIDVREGIEPEKFTVDLYCGDENLLHYIMIKCDCESADDIRHIVYERVAVELFKLGIDKIECRCGKPQKEKGPE